MPINIHTRQASPRTPAANSLSLPLSPSVTPAPPPSFLRRQESRTTSAHQHQHPPGVPTHPSRQLPLPSPITLRHSCPLRHSCAGRNHEPPLPINIHTHQASPRTPAANSLSLPLSPSVIPAPPPSFLHRQESRITSAHQHQHPPGVPTRPGRQLPLPSPITLRHSCPPSVIPAQAGITNHLCPSTSTPTRRPHAPQPPTPSPFPHHPPSFLTPSVIPAQAGTANHSTQTASSTKSTDKPPYPQNPTGTSSSSPNPQGKTPAGDLTDRPD